MKRALVTGGSAGIGKETVRHLAAQGYEVIIAARDKAKGDALVQQIKRETTGAQVEFMQVDLASFPDVIRFAQRIKERGHPIDALILNAGLFTPKLHTNAAGYEFMFAATHLGHFLLTHHLLPQVKASRNGRIVVTSSVAHFFGGDFNFDTLREPSSSTALMFMPFLSYGRSKLANLLFVRELAHRLRNSNVLVNAFHPGPVKSEIWRSTPGLFNALIGPTLISEAKGAETQIYLATAPGLHQSGQYWFKKAVQRGSPASRDEGLALELWHYSERALGIERFGEQDSETRVFDLAQQCA
ncbi:MAG: SDR family oxidoreductase [Aquabacterium sp.]|uniref:SDR family oxidoreductase n=1 Tax=Aquabacterium sp. TaxID=1872578 RepID=UPI0025BAF079|nr:SDR family oxidoreductase [Aquabacterium sp.]MBI5924441.1 SDR family oxidoreductase [Aquabacterium sp.]